MSWRYCPSSVVLVLLLACDCDASAKGLGSAHGCPKLWQEEVNPKWILEDTDSYDAVFALQTDIKPRNGPGKGLQDGVAKSTDKLQIDMTKRHMEAAQLVTK